MRRKGVLCTLGCVGRKVPQRYVYWFRGAQQTDSYEAYLPDRLVGWTPRFGIETAVRGQEAAARLASVSAVVSRAPEAALCLARADGIASSRIEGIIASLKEVSLWDTKRSRPADPPSGNLAEGAAHIAAEAHRIGLDRSRSMRTDDLCAMHKMLFKGTVQEFNPGQFRTEPVWVGSRAVSLPSRARFVPPPHANVPALVDDLTAWASSRQCVAAGGPVGAAAVAHAQFETIHPFDDGNGRVGRAFIHACLARHTTYPAPLPVAAAIDARKAAYMDALAAFDGYLGSPDAEERSYAAAVMIEWMSTAVEVACAYAETIVAAVRTCSQQAAAMRPGTAQRALMEQLIAAPAATVPDIAARLGLSARSAQRAARQLEADGIARVTHDHSPGAPLIVEIPSLLDLVDRRAALLDALWQQADDGHTPEAAIWQPLTADRATA